MIKAIALDTLIHDDREYEHFLESIRNRFQSAIQKDGDSLFTTDAKDLFDVFLSAFPAGVTRQHYTCHACRRFTELYGGLVTITDGGLAVPAVWPAEENTPEAYLEAVGLVRKAVLKSKVTGVFLSQEKVWGIPVTGQWHHMAVVPPSTIIFKKGFQTPFQKMAERKEEFIMLKAGLREFPVAAVDQALKVLRLDALYRSEKCLGVAEWLRDLHARLLGEKNKRLQDNIVWKAVSLAPPGFCHVRSTMIGTLLDDIVSGMDFASISSRFAAKMHPLQYQRPQAPPSAGNIAQAEKVIAGLNAAGSLRRRFARLDEVQSIWLPGEVQDKTKKEGGVFGHLKPKGSTPEIVRLQLPAATMTWDKFQRTVLPGATKIEFRVPSARMNYAAILTASDPDAPPILQWDSPEQRNPFSWYVYHGLSSPNEWALDSGSWVSVTAICLQPSMWFNPENFKHQGEAIVLLLQGAVDQRESGSAIFPETFKSEFHGIRATIEAYSRDAKIEGRESSSANGLMLSRKQEPWRYVRLAVTDRQNDRVEYELDRWD